MKNNYRLSLSYVVNFYSIVVPLEQQSKISF